MFLLAAKLVGVDPSDCLVVEDAEAGVEAALAGGMDVLGVGDSVKGTNATYKAENIAKFNAELIK